jgi:DNA-directed RNA polymerase specialized sigma24 family protein
MGHPAECAPHSGAREIDDLTSETFLGVVRAIPRFRGDEGQFRSWVFVIAHRRLQDERRRLGSPVAALLPVRDLATGIVSLYLGLELLTHLRGDRAPAESLFATARGVASLLDAFVLPPAE